MTVMNLFANSIAVLLMVMVPYMRPCACGDFTLFCACEAAQAAEAEPMCPQ